MARVDVVDLPITTPIAPVHAGRPRCFQIDDVILYLATQQPVGFVLRFSSNSASTTIFDAAVDQCAVCGCAVAVAVFAAVVFAALLTFGVRVRLASGSTV